MNDSRNLEKKRKKEDKQFSDPRPLTTNKKKKTDSSLNNTIKYICHVPVDGNWGSLLEILTLKDLHCKKEMEIFVNFGNIWMAKRKQLRIG